MIQANRVFKIFRREVQDQWRDKRTIFSVVLLPMLMYPVLGMVMLQVTQFMKEKPATVWVSGKNCIGEQLEVFENQRFHSNLQNELDQHLTNLTFDSFENPLHRKIATAYHDRSGRNSAEKMVRWRQVIQQEIVKKNADALVLFSRKGRIDPSNPAKGLAIQMFVNSSKDQSRSVSARISKVIKKLRGTIIKRNLESRSLSADSISPLAFHQTDLAEKRVITANVWSKILPFILVIWTLTGAFYCAIDLCAGEKERGTLETLLSSAASRREVVWGKLLTVMCFSAVSAMLNLSCTIGTGALLSSQFAADSSNALANLGVPHWTSVCWIFLAVIPVSALFSAVAVAISTFARSTKEGQYYLMPVLMGCLPLVVIPISQGAEFTLGMSLIPITGLTFLLRSLIQQDYAIAGLYALPVLLVTSWCVHMAVSWAVNQFNQESVLFRPSERFSFFRSFLHRIQTRDTLPTLGQAIVCGLLILGLRFLIQFSAPAPENWDQFVTLTVVMLVASVAIPSVMLTFFFTRKPWQVLRLRLPNASYLGGAFLLGILFHPAVSTFHDFVLYLYPIGAELQLAQSSMANVFAGAGSMWSIIMVMAILPAVCEELAFRGFILSGFQRLKKSYNTVLFSAIVFGATHGLLQQSIVATLIGCFLAVMAIRSGSILPCIIYHATHNALTLQIPMLNYNSVRGSKLLMAIFEARQLENGMLDISYRPIPALLMVGFGIWLFWKLDSQFSIATKKQEEIDILPPNTNQTAPSCP